MTAQRYNELLNGPLSHPLPMFTVTRLARALMFVVEATGEAGEKALESFCESQESHDNHVDDDPLNASDEGYFADGEPV